MNPPIPDAALKALATFDTCAVANAIECFDVRLRNEGFTNNTLQCHFPDMPPMIGYAVTLRVRSSNPPMEGGTYAQHTDWWDQLDAVPGPHVVVIQDADRRPGGGGAFIGEIHAAILQALGCVGVITDGAVRDVPAVGRTGFQLFSRTLSVSHAYMHVIEVNTPVEVAGLHIRAGDLIHGDRHGIVRIPLAVAAELPVVAARVRDQERVILEFCRSANFSKAGLRKILGEPC
ncbi:MAG: RraA family protein [Chthoniobacter sp.]|uniref:RraA family protein n=1 Tax=Chthoniobacter sp. TaxID=2510640 RepID=UPI0032A2280F